MKNITIIGAGTMGNGIAHVIAQSGYQVALVDVAQDASDKALAIITKNLDRMIAREKITEEDKKNTLSNIKTYTSIEEGIKDTDFVIEAATENIELKLQIFEKLDKLTGPEVLLATNTSSISITKIGAATQRPDKVIGMHFMNPVPIMKLVEVIKGYSTSSETMEKVLNLVNELGKVPVEVNDYPGFVANRILLPMINEAIFALYEAVAGVEEIDTVMKLGVAHPMGPLQLADFIGLDVCLSILNVMHDGLGDPKYRPCPLLKNMVEAGHLGFKSGEGFYSYTHGTKELVVASRFQSNPQNKKEELV